MNFFKKSDSNNNPVFNNIHFLKIQILEIFIFWKYLIFENIQFLEVSSFWKYPLFKNIQIWETYILENIQFLKIFNFRKYPVFESIEVFENIHFFKNIQIMEVSNFRKYPVFGSFHFWEYSILFTEIVFSVMISTTTKTTSDVKKVLQMLLVNVFKIAALILLALLIALTDMMPHC